MKTRGLIFAVAVLAGLVGTLYWSNHHKPSESVQASVDTPPKILTLNESEVSRIDLKKKSDPEMVLTKDNGSWQISSPDKLAADQSAVSGVVSSLSSLSSERLVEEKAGDLSQFGLTNPSLEVDVVSKNNTTHRLLIGDDTPTSNGAYAKLDGDPRVFTIASYTKTSIDKNVNDLRDKRLLTIEPDKVSRVDLTANQQEMEFDRNKDQWQILRPKPLRADSYQVDELVRKLTDAKMDLTADDQKKTASAFASGKPVATARLTTDTGTQELQVRKNKDDYYAKSSLVNGTYKVGNDVGTGFDKKLDDFRNKKLFDFGYSDPDKIEIHDGSKSYFLTKSGEDWFSPDGKKLDLASAESVVDKVRDCEASKFSDSGFGAQAIDISVTSNGGKRVERVSIAKQGSDYLAKRESESGLYVLDAAKLQDLEKAAGELKPAEQKQAKK
jgi:hypothetical protein